MRISVKRTLTVVCAVLCAFACTFGINFALAKADNAAIDSSLNTFDIKKGASVRYAGNDDREGFSYILTISKEQYEGLTAEDSEFSNVKFGVLIAPEMYYSVHPFNTRENINTYYSIGTEESNKAFLYDVKAVSFTLNEEENNYFFRATYYNIADGNITLDLRGVGYISYTKGDNDYEFFFTYDECVRSAATVAEAAIANLDKTADAEKISALETTYLDKIDYSLTAETKTETRVISFAENTSFTAPELDSIKYVKSRNFLKDKYTFAWTLENGDTKHILTEGCSLTDYEGAWNLVCTASCDKLTGGSQVVYTEPVNITALGDVTVNNTTATSQNSNFVYDTTSKKYKNIENVTATSLIYNSATSEDYALTVNVSVKELYANTEKGASVGIVLSAGGNNTITLHANTWTNSRGLIVTAGGKNYTAFGAFNPTGLRANSGLTNSKTEVGGTFSMTVARIDDIIYIYNGFNQLSLTITADGVTNYTSDKDVSSTMYEEVKTGIKNFFNAGDENAFGFYYGSQVGDGAVYEYSIESKLGNKNVIDSLKKLSNATASSVFVNGTTLTSMNGTTKITSNADMPVTYDATKDMYKSNIGNQYGNIYSPVVANGDYMVRFKLNTSEVNSKGSTFVGLRAQIDSTTYLDIFSGYKDGRPRLNTGLTVRFTCNGSVNYFVIDGEFANLSTNRYSNSVSDPTMDLMLVRNGNALALYYYTRYDYTAEYKDAYAGDAAPVTVFDSWKILLSFTFEDSLEDNLKAKQNNHFSAANVTSAAFTWLNSNNSDVTSNDWVNFLSSMKTYMQAGTQTAFAFNQSSNDGDISGRYYSIEVIDDDAAVAAFVANGENNKVENPVVTAENN